MTSLLFLALANRATLDIRDFGAKPDARTLNTVAIQAALDKAASHGGGTVNVPSGTFLTGSIRLRSGVELHLDQGATLLGSSHRSDYQRGNWFSLILANGLHNIAITGPGTIDGNGHLLSQDVLRMVDTGEVKIPNKGWRPSELDRPQILEFQNCANVRIEGVTVSHSCCWVQTYRKCDHLAIQRMKVDSKTYWNNDGIDLVDCQHVVVSDCDVDAADDGICLKSEDPKSDCSDIVVERCRIRSSASAVKFGTASYGGFRHIRVRDISIRDTYRSAVALESVDGGTLSDVSVENIKAINTGNAFFIRLGHRYLNANPGKVQNVVLKGFDVQVPLGQPDKGYAFPGPPFLEPHNTCPAMIVGHRDAPITGIRLENIHIRFCGAGDKSIAFRTPQQVPERPKDYPDFTMFGEVPAWALYLRHVKGIQIRNFTATLDAPDYRPAFLADDVNNLTTKLVKVSGASSDGNWRFSEKP